MGLGKSFKKAFKKVAKVATLGATGKGGWGKKAIGALSGGLVGDSSVYGASGGLGGLTGNNTMADDAARQQSALAQQQRDQEARIAAAQAVYQSNLSADLGRENTSQVVAGGSALGFDAAADPLKKRRNQGGGLSTTLGLG